MILANSNLFFSAIVLLLISGVAYYTAYGLTRFGHWLERGRKGQQDWENHQANERRKSEERSQQWAEERKRTVEQALYTKRWIGLQPRIELFYLKNIRELRNCWSKDDFDQHVAAEVRKIGIPDYLLPLNKHQTVDTIANETQPLEELVISSIKELAKKKILRHHVVAYFDEIEQYVRGDLTRAMFDRLLNIQLSWQLPVATFEENHDELLATLSNVAKNNAHRFPQPKAQEKPKPPPPPPEPTEIVEESEDFDIEELRNEFEENIRMFRKDRVNLGYPVEVVDAEVERLREQFESSIA